MRRRVARPYGLTISVTRLASLIMAMAVLWMLYERLKDPATWRGFAASDESVAQPVENAPHEEQKTVETVVPGPNHQSEEELAAVQRMFEYVIDRSPLKPREMDAYWRLMALWGQFSSGTSPVSTMN